MTDTDELIDQLKNIGNEMLSMGLPGYRYTLNDAIKLIERLDETSRLRADVRRLQKANADLRSENTQMRRTIYIREHSRR